MPPSKNKENSPAIAVFITPHGFGHAARATAVMVELLKLSPHITFHIYTKVPQWFFRESHLSGYVYHEIVTDVGLVQHNSMEEDLPSTMRLLKDTFPFPANFVRHLSEDVQSHGCQLILCDIAPLGILVAQRAGIPAILEENFTWDWIYAGYPEYREELAPIIQTMQSIFSQADYHIQTMPACQPNDQFLMVNPISRPLRQPRHAMRQSLGLDQQRPTVLITMGGIEENNHHPRALKTLRDILFVIIGGASEARREDNLLLLPHHHGIYHPDLVNACDAVVGKLGYSTLAECYQANVSYGFIPRKRFPESPSLADFVATSMHGLPISDEEYANGDWLKIIPALLAQPHDEGQRANGAGEIAGFIRDQLFLR